MHVLATGFAWWLPLNISAHGDRIDNLIVFTHWFMAVLFVGWGIYFAYCLVRFRARPGHQPTSKLPKAKASKYSEVAIVIIEAILLLGFSIPIWASVRGPVHAPDAPNLTWPLPTKETELPGVVRVIAEQFAWHIHYPGRDGVFGPLVPDLIDLETNPLGLDRSDENAKDDVVTLNHLHIPVNKDVLIHLRSRDVIHSFNLPLMRLKQDAVPGMSTPVWFRATRTTDEVRNAMERTLPTRSEQDAGRFKNHVAMKQYKGPGDKVIVDVGEDITKEIVGALAAAGIKQIQAAPSHPTEIACAQLCGLGHYRMRGYLHVDSIEDFEQWWAEREEELAEEEEEEEY